MLIIQANLADISVNASKILPYLQLYPELFLQLHDELPSDTKNFISIFKSNSTTIKNLIDSNQIIKNSIKLPDFIKKDKIINLDQFFTNESITNLYKCELFFSSRESFFDELAFLLYTYKEIYINSSHDIKNGPGGSFVILDSATEKMCTCIQEEMVRRIGEHNWLITMSVKSRITPGFPKSSSPLLPGAWKFRTGRLSPHDRFWADKFSRIYVTTSVGIEFNLHHAPIIYRLSPEVRKKSSIIVKY